MEHSPFNGSTDYPGDYRCAGIATKYHADGVEYARSPAWAGQWLLRDADGVFRIGTCTFNRGTHPTTDGPAERATQTFPNDPDSAKGAYLSWKYGSTRDELTAAAVWAVMHYYAADAAGTYQALDPTSPLVPALDRIAASSGRADLQERAIALDAEAGRNAGPWTLALDADRVDGAVATLTGAMGGIEGAAVRFVLDDGTAADVPTDGEGVARVALGDDVTAVTVSAEGPGELWIFQGPPAGPAGSVGQTLAVAGTPEALAAEATLPPVPTTTTTTSTTTTTTTIPETTTTTTTIPETTTTIPETTSTATTTTTIPETTTTTTTTIPETVPDETVPPPTVPAVTIPSPTLPRTGPASMGVAYLATLALVGGIGLLGTLRRRVKPVVGWWDGCDEHPGERS